MKREHRQVGQCILADQLFAAADAVTRAERMTGIVDDAKAVTPGDVVKSLPRRRIGR